MKDTGRTHKTHAETKETYSEAKETYAEAKETYSEAKERHTQRPGASSRALAAAAAAHLCMTAPASRVRCQKFSRVSARGCRR